MASYKETQREYNAERNFIKAAYLLGMLPGQDNHDGFTDGINVSAVENKLKAVSAHAAPNLLSYEKQKSENSNEMSSERAVLILNEGVGPEMDDGHVEVTKIRQGRNTAMWLIGTFLMLFSLLFMTILLALTKKFRRFALLRNGKPGGGSAAGIALLAERSRNFFLKRGCKILLKLRNDQDLGVTRRKMKNFLTEFDYDYEPWSLGTNCDTDEATIVADQNRFVAAVKIIDDGLVKFAAQALNTIKTTLFMYGVEETRYLSVLDEKAALLVSVSASEFDDTQVLSTFAPEDYHMPDLRTCDYTDVLEYDFRKISDKDEGVEAEKLREYYLVLKNLQAMFSLIGEPAFLQVYMTYVGKMYPCVQEAYKKDLEIRKSRSKDKDNLSLSDVMGLLISLGCAASGVVVIAKGGIYLYKRYWSRSHALMRRLSALPTVPGSGAGGGGVAALETRLASLTSTSTEITGEGPVPSDSLSESWMELEARLNDFISGATGAVSSNNNLVMRATPLMMMPQFFEAQGAKPLLEGISVDKLREENMIFHSESNVAGEDLGVCYEAAREQEEPCVNLSHLGSKYTVVNASSNFPTMIKTSSLSKTPLTSGVECGSFSREQLCAIDTRVFDNRETEETTKVSTAQLLMAGASVFGALKGRKKGTKMNLKSAVSSRVVHTSSSQRQRELGS